MKRFLSLILSFAMLLSIIGGVDLSAFASTYSGTCGDNVTWSFDTSTDGLVLVISGSGDMKDYSYSVSAPWYSYRSYITSVSISNNITSIGSHAFEYCDSITSITIPNGVTSIGDYAFYNCKGLKSVTIPNSVTSIGYDTFKYCSSLTDITIGKNVTSIGLDAFYSTAYYNNGFNWTNKVLYIGKYLISARTTLSGSYSIKKGTLCIANSAFYKCEKMTSVTIPESVKSINFRAFACSSLTSVTIPYGVTSLDSCFLSCDKLISITIPNSVKKVSGFTGCDSLRYVYFIGTKSQLMKIDGISSQSYITDAEIYYISAPKKTSMSKLSNGKKQFKVTWKKKSGATGYQVQYATNKKFTKNKKTVTVKKASTTSKTIKGLKSKKTYYVRVRTYKTVNGTKYYSSWSTVKKVKTK